jgi:amino acid transporter
MLVVIALAMVGDIKVLAKATSVLLLAVFTIINLALVVLKNRSGEPKGTFEVPIFVPVIGALICLVLISHAQIWELLIALILLAAIAVLYVLVSRRHRRAGLPD